MNVFKSVLAECVFCASPPSHLWDFCIVISVFSHRLPVSSAYATSMYVFWMKLTVLSNIAFNEINNYDDVLYNYYSI